jgi:hypothetical protein
MKLKCQNPVAFFEDRVHVFDARQGTDIFRPGIAKVETFAAGEYLSTKEHGVFLHQIIVSFHRGRYLFSLPDNKQERGYLLHTVF